MNVGPDLVDLSSLGSFERAYMDAVATDVGRRKTWRDLFRRTKSSDRGSDPKQSATARTVIHAAPCVAAAYSGSYRVIASMQLSELVGLLH